MDGILRIVTEICTGIDSCSPFFRRSDGSRPGWRRFSIHARSLGPRLRRPRLKPGVYLKTRAVGMTHRRGEFKVRHYRNFFYLLFRKYFFSIDATTT